MNAHMYMLASKTGMYIRDLHMLVILIS